MEKFLEYLQLVSKGGVGELGIGRRLFVAAVLFQRLLHVLANANVIDNETVLLPRILAVDARNRLNERVALQGFVVVEHSQARHVKARNPHIDDDGNAEIR